MDCNRLLDTNARNFPLKLHHLPSDIDIRISNAVKVKYMMELLEYIMEV